MILIIVIIIITNFNINVYNNNICLCHTITTINTKTTTTIEIEKLKRISPPYNPKYISEKNSSALWKNPPQSQAYINNPPGLYI